MDNPNAGKQKTLATSGLNRYQSTQKLPAVFKELNLEIQKELEQLLSQCFTDVELYLSKIINENGKTCPNSLSLEEAKRNLENHKRTIIDCCLDGITEATELLVLPGSTTRNNGNRLNKDTPSEVKKCQTEKTSSLTILAENHYQTYDNELTILITRLNHLLLTNQADKTSIPLNLVKIANNFTKGCELLRPTAEASIECLLEAFSNNVINGFGGIVNEANNLLSRKGILPDIKEIGLSKETTTSTGTTNKKSHSTQTKKAEENNSSIKATPRKEAILNAVDTLFKTCAQSKDIPNISKVAIDKLQIPILKAALDDDNVLKYQDHPAIKLIYYITLVGIRSENKSDQEQINTQNDLVEITTMVAREYDANKNIFFDALKTVRGLDPGLA